VAVRLSMALAHAQGLAPVAPELIRLTNHRASARPVLPCQR
jgi:hypothetical protein